MGTAGIRTAAEHRGSNCNGGYDYIRFNINASASVLQPPSETFNANGAGGQLVYNVNNWLGILGDLSGYWATNATRAGAALPYLFAPRASAFPSTDLAKIPTIRLRPGVTSR